MKTVFFTFVTLLITFFSFSQTKEKGTILRTDPNGVVVYKTIGVENTMNAKPQNYQKIDVQKEGPPIKTINDYTLEELEGMLPDIDLKIEMYRHEITDDEESRNAEIERCQAYKKAIKDRIEELKS